MNKEETIKKLRNEYMRNWRNKNRDKVKEANRKYWEKKANSYINGELDSNNVA